MGPAREKQLPAYAGRPWTLWVAVGTLCGGACFQSASSARCCGLSLSWPLWPPMTSAPLGANTAPISLLARLSQRYLLFCGGVGYVGLRACSVVCVYREPTPESQPWAAGHLGQALSEKGPKAGVRKWKVAEFSWPSLQAEAQGNVPRPAGSQSGHPCGPRLSVCSTPAGGDGCHSGRRARLCSGPRKVPGSDLQPTLRLENVARGRAVHSFPFLGSPW